MALKHQDQCYRTLNGKRYENYCDLVYSDAENTKAIEEAKKLYKWVQKMKHWKGGYYQLFVRELISKPKAKTNEEKEILIANFAGFPGDPGSPGFSARQRCFVLGMMQFTFAINWQINVLNKIAELGYIYEITHKKCIIKGKTGAPYFCNEEELTPHAIRETLIEFIHYFNAL